MIIIHPLSLSLFLSQQLGIILITNYPFLSFICSFVWLPCFLQAQKAEKDATDLKGSMRKRMEFLDFDWRLPQLPRSSNFHWWFMPFRKYYRGWSMMVGISQEWDGLCFLPFPSFHGLSLPSPFKKMCNSSIVLMWQLLRRRMFGFLFWWFRCISYVSFFYIVAFEIRDDLSGKEFESKEWF